MFILPTGLPLSFLAREAIRAPFIDGRANKGNNMSMVPSNKKVSSKSSAMAFGMWFATTYYYFFLGFSFWFDLLVRFKLGKGSGFVTEAHT